MDPQTMAAILGFTANIPLIIGICRDTIKQNFTTFMLWAILDLIATITIYLQNGNWALPFAYFLSATTITILLALKRRTEWTKTETVTVVMVAGCLIAWYHSGPYAGTIASSLANFFASWPQMRDTYREPRSTPSGIYLWFLFANTLSLIAGDAWTVEDRMYSGCVVLLCLVITIFSLRDVRSWSAFWRRAIALT